MKTALNVQLGQHLRLAPQLLQSIRLLQLPGLELEQEVRDALERNVMLEADGDAAPDADAAARDERDFEPVSAGGDEDGEGFEARTAAPEITDARLKILSQLQLMLQPRELAIAECLLDQISEAGYLEQPFAVVREAVQASISCTPAEILAVLHQVQRLDPPGYGAADLRDCLLIQLELLGPNTRGRTLAMRLVDTHLDALAAGDVDALAAAVGESVGAVERAIALIRTLSPKPGAAGDDGAAQYVRPDVILRRVAGRWQVALNAHTAPRLRVNGLYEALLNRCDGEQEAQALRDQLQEARWLVRGLAMRNDTLLKVSRVIVERQAAFLERGEEGLRPLTLREVADAIGMHESTVSRITTRKYAQTPRGIFELKRFFASSLAHGDPAGASGAAVRAMVRRLIEAESPSAPLADGVIAQLLERQGVRVARRTVSKYREALNIAPARERARVSEAREGSVAC